MFDDAGVVDFVFFVVFCIIGLVVQGFVMVYEWRPPKKSSPLSGEDQA